MSTECHHGLGCSVTGITAENSLEDVICSEDDAEYSCDSVLEVLATWSANSTT